MTPMEADMSDPKGEDRLWVAAAKGQQGTTAAQDEEFINEVLDEIK